MLRLSDFQSLMNDWRIWTGCLDRGTLGPREPHLPMCVHTAHPFPDFLVPNRERDEISTVV